MNATLVFHQKLTLRNESGTREAIFEMIVWKVPKDKDFPEGIRYRAWMSEEGVTLFGFDNHKPKGPHLHVGEKELGYLFRGYDELVKDIRKMIEQEGYVYED
jgi:hypothetical protein